MIPVIKKAITKYIPNIIVIYTDGTVSSSNTYDVEWNTVKTLILHRDCTIISDGNIRFRNLENIIYNGFTLSFEGSLEYMFYYSKFNGDISNWDVGNVKYMKNMFCYSEFNRDISKWNVGNVEDMSSMFGSSKFNGDISNWNVSKCTTMNCMFYDSKFNGDISNWNVENVESMDNMFSYSSFNGDISNWNFNINVDRSYLNLV